MNSNKIILIISILICLLGIINGDICNPGGCNDSGCAVFGCRCEMDTDCTACGNASVCNGTSLTGFGPAARICCQPSIDCFY
jgi:hypothetical protein